MDETRFLRPDAIIEPLVDGFYAWLHTVTPVQAAMNLAFVQVPLLESCLQSPLVHINACRNPQLRGGFFVGIEESRSGEVRDLLASIKRDRAEMLGFAQAVAEAEELVRTSATGFDLTPLYPKLPSALSGLVEIAYDTSNQPAIRYIEPGGVQEQRLHRGASIGSAISGNRGRAPVHLEHTAACLIGSPGPADTVPASRSGGAVQVEGARYDAGWLREMLELDDDETAALAGLMAKQPDLSADRHIDSGARIRYFNHACLVLQTPEAAIITDPWVSADASATDRFTYRDLPDHIDLALITHGHQDHIVLETLLALRGRIGTVVVPRSSRGNMADPSIALYLSHLGLPVTEVDDFSEVEFPGGTVTATPFLGEHADLDIRAKSTYCVRLGGPAVFVGADSSGIDPGLYRYMRGEVGQVDVAFLGMECAGAPLTWLYQGLLTKPVTKKMSDSRTLSGSNAEQAAGIMTELGASEAYVYAMGEESWLGHVMATTYNEDSYQLKQVAEFVAWCADHGIKSDHLLGQAEWRW